MVAQRVGVVRSECLLLNRLKYLGKEGRITDKLC